MNAKSETPVESTRAVLPILEACEPRLLLSGSDFSADIDWLHYFDNLGREVAPGFSSGQPVNGQYAIPDSDVLNRAAGEPTSFFSYGTVRLDEDLNLSGGRMTVAIPQPVNAIKTIPNAAITVDGQTGDWASVGDYIYDGLARMNWWPVASGADVESMKLAYGGGYLNILLNLDGQPSTGLDYFLYVDSDANGDNEDPGDYRVDVHFGGSWRIDVEQMNDTGDWVGVLAAGNVVVNGNILEAQVQASSLNLPGPVDVSLTVGNWGDTGYEYDHLSTHLMESKGYLSMGGQKLTSGDATTWTLAGRFTSFANCTLENRIYSVSLTTGSGDGAFLSPEVCASWFTGTYNGVHYDHELVIEAGVGSGADSEEYDWWWGPGEGAGLFLGSLDTSATAVDLKIVVSNNAQTATFYYRVNSSSADASGNDWTVLVSHTLPSGHSPMLGLPEATMMTDLEASYVNTTPQPDLTASLGNVTLPQASVPGDKVSIPATVTNIGADKAVGPVTVTLYGSPDNKLDLSGNDPDPEIGDLTASVKLAKGQSKDFVFSLTIPPDAIPGSYYLIAVVEASPAINEVNTSNNLDVSDNTLEIIWQAGTFGTRTNFALTVEDKNGVPTTFALGGGGHVEFVGGEEFTQIVIKDTSANSTLTITTPGGTSTSIGEIVVAGSLKSLIAKSVTLLGNLTVEGTIGTLVLGTVDSDHNISINSKGPISPGLPPCTIIFDIVNDCDLITNGIPIKSLVATEWTGDGLIEAPWIGSLTIKGDKKRQIAGDFEADLKLEASPPLKPILGAVKIAGDLANAEWDLANGDVGAVQIGGDVHYLDMDDARNIKSFKAMMFEESQLTASGEIGAFTVGLWEDSDLVADSVKSLTTGDFSWGLLVLQGYHALGKPVLGSAKVGNITDSAQDPDSRGWVVMGDVGAVTVGDVDDWYFRADKAVKSIKAGVVTDAKTEIGGLLGSVTAKSWVGGGIWADSAGTIATIGDKKLGKPGDFVANLALPGKFVATGKPVLGAAKVAGDIGADGAITVEWYLKGDVGTIAAKGDIWHLRADSTAIGNLKSFAAGTAHDTQIKATGAIGTLQLKEWDTGKLQADSLAAFKITGDAKGGIQGELKHFDMLLQGSKVLTGKLALGTMSVADEVHESTLRLHGHAGVLTAGAFNKSGLYLGCADVTGSIDDFSSAPGAYYQFTLAALNLKGAPGQTGTYYFNESEVGAYNIGALRFAGDPVGISGTIEYNQLGSVTPPLLGGSASVLTKV